MFLEVLVKFQALHVHPLLRSFMEMLILFSSRMLEKAQVLSIMIMVSLYIPCYINIFFSNLVFLKNIFDLTEMDN